MAALISAAAALGAGSVAAQEDLTRGKTPAQLFSSDCADCHKNPRSLTNRSNATALANFLRVHYTASRESAAAIAAYLVALGNEPAARTPARPSSSTRSKPAASEEPQGKSSQTRTPEKPAEKPADKPAADKPAEKPADKPVAEKAAETPAETAPPKPPAASAPEAPAAAAPAAPAAAAPATEPAAKPPATSE